MESQSLSTQFNNMGNLAPFISANNILNGNSQLCQNLSPLPKEAENLYRYAATLQLYLSQFSQLSQQSAKESPCKESEMHEKACQESCVSPLVSPDWHTLLANFLCAPRHNPLEYPNSTTQQFDFSKPNIDGKEWLFNPTSRTGTFTYFSHVNHWNLEISYIFQDFHFIRC